MLAKGPVLVLCTKFNVQIGTDRHVSPPMLTLMGFGLTSLSGVCHGNIPLQLKTNTIQCLGQHDYCAVL
jgi:hypothetical protein